MVWWKKIHFLHIMTLSKCLNTWSRESNKRSTPLILILGVEPMHTLFTFTVPVAPDRAPCNGRCARNVMNGLMSPCTWGWGNIFLVEALPCYSQNYNTDDLMHDSKGKYQRSMKEKILSLWKCHKKVIIPLATWRGNCATFYLISGAAPTCTCSDTEIYKHPLSCQFVTKG